MAVALAAAGEQVQRLCGPRASAEGARIVRAIEG
jgi:hypothetical protein